MDISPLPQAPSPENPASNNSEQGAPQLEAMPLPGEVAGSVASQPGAGAPVVSLPTLPVVSPKADNSVDQTPHVTGPSIADDVDVIEKEWVDQAKQIITATSQDPYVEEEAIEDLQVDYLNKRYGKKVAKDPREQPNDKSGS
ncbi:MAG: hypothetical protein ACHQUB_03085 [Candidatus Saccharimonadia bacterium]